MGNGVISGSLSGRVARIGINRPEKRNAQDRAMLCGSPAMLADFRALLDGRGFTAAPRIGVPGSYVFERAFVEK